MYPFSKCKSVAHSDCALCTSCKNEEYTNWVGVRLLGLAFASCACTFCAPHDLLLDGFFYYYLSLSILICRVPKIVSLLSELTTLKYNTVQIERCSVLLEAFVNDAWTSFSDANEIASKANQIMLC